MRVLVLADTHVRPGGRGLPAPVLGSLDEADVVLHAGDVVSGHLLDELARRAPTHAVLGNNDDAGLAGRLTETLEVELDGVPVAMVHDAGPAKGRERRLHRRFPGAALVVFGHSHIPWDAPGEGGQHLFNPGSPTQRRRQPRPSYGVVDLAGGVVVRTEVVRF